MGIYELPFLDNYVSCWRQLLEAFKNILLKRNQYIYIYIYIHISFKNIIIEVKTTAMENQSFLPLQVFKNNSLQIEKREIQKYQFSNNINTITQFLPNGFTYMFFEQWDLQAHFPRHLLLKVLTSIIFDAKN